MRLLHRLRDRLRSLYQRILNRIRRKPVASFNKFNAVAASAWNAGFNLGTDAVKVLLTNTAPIATNAAYADVSAGELATGNGYTVGGATVTLVSSTQTGGLYKYIASCASPTWTASGAVGPFRYVVMYDTTPAAKPLIGWWDYGSAVTMASGDTFTVQLDATNGVIQMS